MPDAIQPVGAMIQPPDPSKGLGMMSSILGIQQQRLGLQQAQQNLQTGQYTQQTAQAGSQLAQQKASEMQAVGNLVKQSYTSGRYKGADGNFDNQKFANDVNAVAPVNGAQIANDAVSRAGEIYKNQQTLFNLESSKRAQVGDTVGALAGDKDVTQSKIIDAFEGLRQQHPDDKALSRMLQSTQGSIPPNATGPQLQQVLNTMASGMKGTAAQGSTTNAASQIVNQGTYSRILSAPGEVPGSPNNLNPASPKVAGAAAGEVSRAGGSGNADIDRSNQVSAAVAPANKTVLITNEIDGLADQIHSGKLSASISKAAAAAGLSSTTYARQLLEKDLGQLRTNATPASATDQRQATVISGLPEATSDPQTIHTSMDYTRGVARQDLARGAQLNAIKSKDPSLRGFQAADDTLTGTTDPLMHEFKSLNTPADRIAFYKRNFSNAKDPAAAAEAFRNKVAGMGHVFGQ